VLLILSGLALAAALFLAPRYYYEDRVAKGSDKFLNDHWKDFEAVERHWKTLPVLQYIRSGSEPEVVKFLSEQPLVVAMLDRFEGGGLWFRKDNHLVAPWDSMLEQQYLDWMAHAEEARRFEWNPPKEQDPDFGKVATVVLLSDRWLVLKRWRPGSREVERELATALPPGARIRIGLLRESDAERADLKFESWGADPHLQADPASMTYVTLSTTLKTNAFGDGWSLGGVGLAADRQTHWEELRRQYWMSWGVSLLVGLAIILGVWLRYRTRRRALLDADRLASMTHSLKTPLAILKLRCDTLRLGHLDPEQADATLIRIGDEVDHLTLLIENGLRVVRGGAPSGPIGRADQEWFEEVVEDLRPAFDQESRVLELNLAATEVAEAPLPSLQAALLTLLENALGHGKGRVKVETWRHRRRFCIQVSDEGEGIEPHQLKVLGKPFQRLRETGKEGFLREGQGLGLSLLIQVAQQEGWGLSFSSGLGQGFTALLEVPASRRAFPPTS
jgi:signal transduction histidine kinase